MQGKCGYINKRGKTVILFKYDDAWDFFNGLACVKLDGKWDCINKRGKTVIPFKYDDAIPSFFPYDRIPPFSLLRTIAVKSNEEWFYVDKQGNFVEDIEELEIRSAYSVESNGKWGYCEEIFWEDYSANTMDYQVYNKSIDIPCIFDKSFSFSGGLAPVSLNGKWGVIDKTGKEIIPCKYDEVKYDHVSVSFSDCPIAVKLDDKYGFIDKTGIETVPFKYDNACAFSEELACVKLDGKWGYIDKTGQEISLCKYDNVRLRQRLILLSFRSIKSRI
jgi:hypothetical protein